MLLLLLGGGSVLGSLARMHRYVLKLRGVKARGLAYRVLHLLIPDPLLLHSLHVEHLEALPLTRVLHGLGALLEEVEGPALALCTVMPVVREGATYS